MDTHSVVWDYIIASVVSHNLVAPHLCFSLFLLLLPSHSFITLTASRPPAAYTTILFCVSCVNL